jgi:hypothetical protein
VQNYTASADSKTCWTNRWEIGVRLSYLSCQILKTIRKSKDGVSKPDTCFAKWKRLHRIVGTGYKLKLVSKLRHWLDGIEGTLRYLKCKLVYGVLVRHA